MIFTLHQQANPAAIVVDGCAGAYTLLCLGGGRPVRLSERMNPRFGH